MFAYQRLIQQPRANSSSARAAAERPPLHDTSAACGPSPTSLGRLYACGLLGVSFLWSLLIAASVRCHSPLAAHLYYQLPGYGDKGEFHWLGCCYGMMVFLFVPLWSGLIDLGKLSYRACAASVGLLALLAGVVSAGIQDPGHLVLTDAILGGTAGSIGLATLALVIDDNFPDSSRLRVFATTFVQGNSLATFYLVDAFSRALPAWGWRGAFYALAGCHCGLSAVGAALFVRRPERRWQRLRAAEEEEVTGGVGAAGASVIDKIREPQEWPRRLLSLSQEEFDNSQTVLMWLLERLIAAIITDGMFLYLLLRSGILDLVHGSPPTNGTMAARTPLHNRLVVASSSHSSASATAALAESTALAFSAGSSFAYIAGGLLGGLARGRLLVVYMAGSLTVLCSLIGWLGVAGSGSDELAFALICGLGVGAFNTFAYAASEEATGVPARSMFPFTKVANGVSLATLEVVRASLADSGVSQGDVLLVLLLLLSMAQVSTQLLVRRVNARRGLRPKRRPS